MVPIGSEASRAGRSRVPVRNALPLRHDAGRLRIWNEPRSIRSVKSLPKRILFRLHWLCGISAGVVLSIVGVTGALIAFEAEMLRAMNPEWRVADTQRGMMPLGSLVDAARAAHPDARVRGIVWDGEGLAVIARMTSGRERGALQVAVDPTTGVVLGSPRGAEFFDAIEQLHRN